MVKSIFECGDISGRRFRGHGFSVNIVMGDSDEGALITSVWFHRKASGQVGRHPVCATESDGNGRGNHARYGVGCLDEGAC